MKSVVSSKKAGRPREFCTEQALEIALHLFWRKGYEGTSLTDLTDAIGVNRPSLYAAFGSKEELFRLVLDRYAEKYDAALTAALARPTARGVAEALLLSSARDPSPTEASGCLLVQGALVCSDAGDSIRHELSRRREAMVMVLRRRFESAKAEGDVTVCAGPADLARYVVTVMNGMAVQSAGGAETDTLRRVAEIALAMWPASPAEALRFDTSFPAVL